MSITSSASGAEEVLERIRTVLALGVSEWRPAHLYRCDLADLAPVSPPPYPSRVVAVDPVQDRLLFERAHPAAGDECDGAVLESDRMFAVVRNGRVVAWTRIGTAGGGGVGLGCSEALVRGVWVEPAARVTGIGSGLVAAGLEAVRSDGACSAAVCVVDPADADTRDLLVALGFERRGTGHLLRPLGHSGDVPRG